MAEYKLICRSCNKEFAREKTPVFDKAPTTCDVCGAGLSVREVLYEDKPDESFDFDIVLYNKRTNESVRNGFSIASEKVKGKEGEELQDVMVHHIAESLAGLVSPENVVKLMRK